MSQDLQGTQILCWHSELNRCITFYEKITLNSTGITQSVRPSLLPILSNIEDQSFIDNDNEYYLT